jgi:hypothetical protein
LLGFEYLDAIVCAVRYIALAQIVEFCGFGVVQLAFLGALFAEEEFEVAVEMPSGFSK